MCIRDRCEIGLARGREAANAADLDADRREVREAAKGEGRDDLALLREAAGDVLEHREGEELVDDGLVRDEVADRRGVLLRRPEDYRERAHDPVSYTHLRAH